ncbi:hypothetical protein L1987_48429 [Smallanthus sonchifolius]|uniref:Uncharacterized protein n=1 Tax=Smallanthus sonchifolius TaxID=185202 RepID=A0ACB9FST6_9ASTR|nr:hypothetical protein L1987_48429 [Smallanthus sonchifolius]
MRFQKRSIVRIQTDLRYTFVIKENILVNRNNYHQNTKLLSRNRRSFSQNSNPSFRSNFSQAVKESFSAISSIITGLRGLAGIAVEVAGSRYRRRRNFLLPLSINPILSKMAGNRDHPYLEFDLNEHEYEAHLDVLWPRRGRILAARRLEPAAIDVIGASDKDIHRGYHRVSNIGGQGPVLARVWIWDVLRTYQVRSRDVLRTYQVRRRKIMRTYQVRKKNSLRTCQVLMSKTSLNVWTQTDYGANARMSVWVTNANASTETMAGGGRTGRRGGRTGRVGRPPLNQRHEEEESVHAEHTESVHKTEVTPTGNNSQGPLQLEPEVRDAIAREVVLTLKKVLPDLLSEALKKSKEEDEGDHEEKVYDSDGDEVNVRSSNRGCTYKGFKDGDPPKFDGNKD